MDAVFYIALVVSLCLVAFWAEGYGLGQGERNRLRHQACLDHIARMEKAMGIGEESERV